MYRAVEHSPKAKMKQSWFLGVSLGLVQDVQSIRAFSQGKNETELVPWCLSGPWYRMYRAIKHCPKAHENRAGAMGSPCALHRIYRAIKHCPKAHENRAGAIGSPWALHRMYRAIKHFPQQNKTDLVLWGLPLPCTGCTEPLSFV